MLDPAQLLEKAKHSRTYLTLLNVGLNRIIPFNKPHGFRIIALADDHIETMLPYKKRNLNHIKGLHACALATLSEFTTGALLLGNLSPKKYRLILSKLTVTYLYQGKTEAYAHFQIESDWIEQQILQPAKEEGKALVTCNVNTYDAHKNKLTEAAVTWQVKTWEQVKTKIN